MNTSIIPADIYRCPYYEYLLVIKPTENVNEKILQVKEEFSKKFAVLQATHSYPHITLVNFLQFKMLENRLINRLNTIAMGYHPFTVNLKDFGSFPAHTIYINVTTKVPVQNLTKTIRAETQRLMKLNDDNKPYFIMEPHLTIARKLQPWQYEKGWLEYSTKNFTGRFIADGMLLLKRPVGEVKYQIVKRFEFQNLPVVTKQGELFV